MLFYLYVGFVCSGDGVLFRHRLVWAIIIYTYGYSIPRLMQRAASSSISTATSLPPFNNLGRLWVGEWVDGCHVGTPVSFARLLACQFYYLLLLRQHLLREVPAPTIRTLYHLEVLLAQEKLKDRCWPRSKPCPRHGRENIETTYYSTVLLRSLMRQVCAS